MNGKLQPPKPQPEPEPGVIHRVPGVLQRLLGVPHRVPGVLHWVLGILRRVLGVLHRVLKIPDRVPGVLCRVLRTYIEPNNKKPKNHWNQTSDFPEGIVLRGDY